jgi:ABC-type branched-subunit amino acid transport system permease subunit
MQLADAIHMSLVAIPLVAMFGVGLLFKVPLTNLQILYIGLPLYAVAVIFSTLAYKVTKVVVGKYGIDRELNPIVRSSLQKGTADQDRRMLLTVLVAVLSLEYLWNPNVWFFVAFGAVGTNFLDWLNDYRVLKRC